MMILSKNIPSIDLHGFDRDYARIMINDFILDNYKIHKEYISVIHGIGSGVLKKVTHETLKTNKYVLEYELNNFNNGETIVKIKK